MRNRMDFLLGAGFGFKSVDCKDIEIYTSIMKTPRGEFVKRLLHYRQPAKNYLKYGEMLRPIRWAGIN